MDFYELLNNPAFMAFLGRLAGSLTGGAAKKLVATIKASEPVEHMLLDCFEEAYAATCEEVGWEYDSSALTETLLLELSQNKGYLTSEDFKKILEDASGMENLVSPVTAVFFGDEVMRRIAKPKHQELFNYLLAQNILASPYDSARAMSQHFTQQTNRFHFSSGNVGFFGREKELEKLTDFCNTDAHFLWWAITGAGGLGKSRLAYDFATEELPEGWTYCFRRGDERDALRLCGQDLPNNTLFIIDYAEENTGDVFEWMSNDLQIQKHAGIKIRVLLLQRSGRTLEDLYGRDTYSSTISDTFYLPRALVLSTLSAEVLGEIAKDYVRKISGRTIRKATASQIGVTLESFAGTKRDKQVFMRPLFALALADAHASGRNIREWDKETLLDYLFNKEKRMIERSLISRCGTNKYSKIGLKALLVATVIGKVDCNEDFAKAALMEREYQDWTHGTSAEIDGFFSDSNLFPDEKGICLALEPDIIGEYFVLKYFASLDDEEKQQLSSFIWRHIPEATSFIRRSNEDFGTESKSENLNHLCTSINIPEGVTEIGNEAFFGCESLKRVNIPESVTTIKCHTFWLKNFNRVNMIRLPS